MRIKSSIENVTIVILVFIVISMTSCSDNVSKNQLPGVYIWNNFEKGRLTINSDSTYSYQFDLALNDTIQNIGTWEFDAKLQEISFNNFRFNKSEGPIGVWISRVRIRKNEIHLIYASDSNIYLKKTNK